MAAKWWRFSRYEVRSGRARCIAPASGADLIEYYPGDSVAEKPYLSLLEAAKAVAPYLQSPPDAPERRRGEETLVDWCNQYGLLGVLHHRVPMLTLAPRWQQPLGTDGPLFPFATQYVRRGAGWLVHHVAKGAVATDPKLRAGMVMAPELRSPALPRPAVLIHDLLSFTPPIEEPLSATWARFFPDVPDWQSEEYPYPAPDTVEFARIYAEPLDEIVGAALILDQAVRALTAPHPAQEAFHNSAWALSQLASLCVPALQPAGDGRYQLRWAVGTLLGVLSMTAMEDLSRRSLRRCQNEKCGHFFLSDAYQATYCSERCRNAVLARRFRSRQKARKSRKGVRHG